MAYFNIIEGNLESIFSAVSSGDVANTSVFSYKPQDRIDSKIKELEQVRAKKLQDQRVIGRVTNKKSEVSYHINTRKVNFHWQKGNKIGKSENLGTRILRR